ncbi:zinc-binding dehydrogenase [Alicyclobacillus fastidiosus]|nr:hypothetical protein GCM10025859_15810 [Alicyclobacillus fastidiosus]
MAKRLGADHVINMLNSDDRAAHLDITRGRGYAVVLETAGAIPTMQSSFELAANKAKVCFVGADEGNHI